MLPTRTQLEGKGENKASVLDPPHSFRAKPLLAFASGMGVQLGGSGRSTARVHGVTYRHLNLHRKSTKGQLKPYLILLALNAPHML